VLGLTCSIVGRICSSSRLGRYFQLYVPLHDAEVSFVLRSLAAEKITSTDCYSNPGSTPGSLSPNKTKGRQIPATTAAADVPRFRYDPTFSLVPVSHWV